MLLNYIFKNLSSRDYNRTKISKEKSFISVVMLLLVVTSVQSQATFTSVQSGNFTDPVTWGTATAPTSIDNIIIAAGTTVLLDDLITVNNATIGGTLESGSNSADFIITGNLTVNSGGLFDGIFYYDAGGWGYDKGTQLTVAGNITNNGRIDLSIGASYLPEGALNLNGSTVQTVSGLGTFGGTLYLTDNTNTGAVINQLIVNNTSTATPNIIWGFNNIKIRSVLSLTNTRINLGTNKMTIGNYATASSTIASGSGFLSGTIGRWYSQYDNPIAITPGTDYYNSNTLFPFISANGKSRSTFISRPNDPNVSGTSGELSVTYYDETGVASGFSVTDGSYTVTDIYEGAWTIAKDATYAFPLGNHTIAFSVQDAYLIKNGNSRIIKVDGTTIGNHQTGTVTPFASRKNLSDSDLDNTFQVGYNAALDTPVTSVQTGDWNTTSTWSSNSIPTCGDTVTLLSGHTVTVNATNSVAGINISAGATLVSESSTLTIGCTNNNATFFNGGTYTINGGSLVVNGNVVHANGSTFNQIAGDIIVDGNHNGDAATSTDQTIFKIENATLNLTGGSITIVDPAVSSASIATTHTATAIVPCTGWFCWYPSSVTLDAIDGVSVGQVIVGDGIPFGTTVANINFDGSINTNPSLPETGLTLPLSLTFYNVSSSPSTFVYQSSSHYAIGANHTLKIGDGISIEKSTVTTNGFNCNFRAGEGVLSLNNLIVNAPDATNRFVNLDSSNSSGSSIMNVQNDFTITQGKVKGQGVDTYFGGNVINNGALNLYNNTYFGNYIDGNSVATDKAQTISGSGTFNAQTETILNTPANTGSVSQLRVNNTSAEGVTFLVPFNVVVGLTMTEGIIHTSATSVLTVGAPAMSYTASVTGNFGETCYIDGPFAKDIGGGQNATDLNSEFDFVIERFLFPVGKSSYSPIWVAVTTPAGGFGSPGTNLKVEAFETNPGTPSANIAYLSQNRWEVSKTAGTVIDFNIKVADANAIETSIIVQAPSAAGIYDNDFGITATFEAGTPNILTSNADPLPFADFYGYFSTARQAECSAVTPGNTLSTETSICGGKAVTLSLENIVVGEGITYQWQSSTTDSNYTDIDGATDTTASVAPVENTYYRCNVTCSFSTTTVASTPIQITLNNTIVTTTPATICQPTDTATLSATSSVGDVKWYASQVGGTALATGNSFTTPVITATTTYYAGTESSTAGTAGMAYTNDGYGSGTLDRGLAFNLSNSIILNSVKVYPQQNPGGTGAAPITIKVFQNGIQVPGTADVIFTPDTASGWSPTNTAQTVALNYVLQAGENYTLLITDGASYDNTLAYVSPFPSPFPVNTGAVSIVGGYAYGDVDTYSYYFFFDWNITEVCSSARVPVTATVQTVEECDLGNPTSQLLSRVVAYPNPYSSTFRLDIQTNNAADVNIKVYDMVGRLIEYRTVSHNELSNVEIGNGYPSGIYNVSVTQEGKAKTLQVVKR
ncbi:T9SS type A sorting domain-containing protein [Flavobacterium sp.]|uniref:Ig-like domain-containing protein n=1 Tax=Flavobacterium sp. TaxID=239 RepID=UPI00391D34A6